MDPISQPSDGQELKGCSLFVISIGELAVDIILQKATLMGKLLELTWTEYSFLQYLALRNGIPGSMGTLIDHLSPPGKRVTPNFVSTYLCRLRGKIGEAYLPRGQLSDDEKGFRLVAPYAVRGDS
jgi:DNA-binding response OmpR family regulator